MDLDEIRDAIARQFATATPFAMREEIVDAAARNISQVLVAEEHARAEAVRALVAAVECVERDLALEDPTHEMGCDCPLSTQDAIAAVRALYPESK